MDNLQTPQSQETKDYLEKECGLVPYAPVRAPNYADPDHASYHMTSALIFGLSAAGRWYAPKLGVTRAPYTLSMVMVPVFYFLSINLKEKRFPYDFFDSSARRTLEQNLEFYPVTRRAWNRALSIHNGGNSQ